MAEDMDTEIEDNITEDITVGIKFKLVVSSSLKPVEGMIFPSLDASYQFYVEYANKGGFSVRKGSQTEKNGFIQYKYFICSKEGSKPQKKFDSLEEVHQGKKQKKCRNRPSIRTSCLAQIALCTVDGGKSYKINKFIEEHNHTLVSQEDMHFLPSSRNLIVMQQKRLYSLSTLNLGPVKSFNILRTEYCGFDDVGVTAADCKNFKRNINCYIEEFDAEMIVQRLLNKKEYKMVFVPFTGINNHFRNVNLGAGLIAKEMNESYTWLLTCFLKASGRQPKVVVTDQDPAMKQAIESVFTESKHRLCMWHIMKKIADKVGPTLCNNENFKCRICNIVWTDSIKPDEFEMAWHEIVNEFGLIDNSWISTMFGLRSMWIPTYYRDEPLSGLMRTTSRYAHRKNDHYTMNTKPGECTESDLEVDALKRYTQTIFGMFKKKYIVVLANVIPLVLLKMDRMQKSMLKIKKLLKKVSFRYPSMLLIMIFLLHVAAKGLSNMIDEIPKKYILRRWMRDAVSNKSKCSIFGKDVANGNIDKANEIVRDIMFATENICNMLFTDIEALSKVRDQINDMREKAEEGSQAKPIFKKNDMLASLLGYDQPSTSTIRVPTGIRNKGRGSHKRFKSLKEIAASRAGKRSRVCSVCGEGGHDIRTCKKMPVYPPKHPPGP
ncbi:protein FAR1-RELATED SEQUENCE 5-like [Bidens hawaiensis]|uniref:protein FAR1-RELATED SEQUENCE 5-like n=1 Tax=Bidens hawaiensis TaxID=980011 RepID=UPI00404ACD3A